MILGFEVRVYTDLLIVFVVLIFDHPIVRVSVGRSRDFNFLKKVFYFLFF